MPRCYTSSAIQMTIATAIVCGLALLLSNSLNAVRLTLTEQTPTRPDYQITPEYEATLAMLSAHAPLRVPEVLNPDSSSNRKALDTMMRKAMAGQAGPPPFIPPQPSFDSDVVGSLDGRFSLDNKGAGEYSVDLPVPGGRGAPTPSLSLCYSSTMGHSSAGLKFYIADGYHNAITRGRRFHARDGEARGTELSQRDRLYFDGKILVCTSGQNTYGLPGSTYRTEVDSFNQIQAIGKGEEIEGFTLLDKSGYKYFFGKHNGQSDAQHRGRDATQPNKLNDVVSEYALKRVENQFGYYLTFHYEELAPGNWKTRFIDYTGTPEHLPDYRVEYKYRSTFKTTTRYDALTLEQGNFVIDEITITYLPEQTLLNRYDLVYEDASPDKTIRLKELRPYLAADIAEPLLAVSPTTFYWSKAFDADGDYAKQKLPKGTKKHHPLTPQFWADFNGDGKDDLLTVQESLLMLTSDNEGLANAKAKAWASPKDYAPQHPNSKPQAAYTTGEFNGDSMTDILILYPGQEAIVLKSTGDAFTELVRFNIHEKSDSKTKLVTGDINGDGRDDILLHNSDQKLLAYLYQSNGFTEEPFESSLGLLRSETLRDTKGILKDLNGDGLEDYLWLELNTSKTDTTNDRSDLSIRYSLSNPSGGFASPITLKTWQSLNLLALDDNSLSQAEIGFLMGDFNSDDEPDFAFGTVNDNSTEWEIILNKDQPTSILKPTTTQVATLKSSSTRIKIPRPLAKQSPASKSHPPEPILNTKTLELRYPGAPQVLDANQDGSDDLVWIETGGANARSTLLASYSNGDGSFSEPSPLLGEIWDKTDIARYAKKHPFTTDKSLYLNWQYDNNGDGLNELILLRKDVNGYSKTLTIVDGYDRENVSGPLRNMMIALVEGKGRTVCVSYRAGRDDRSYTPGSVVEYPIREQRTTTPVVSEIWKDEASGHFAQFGYLFSGKRTDLSGRGNLGFASFTTIDRHSGFLSFQQVGQSFPVTGLVTREEVYRTWREGKDFKIKVVKKVDYSCTFDAVTSPESLTYYGTVYPYQSTKRETNWEDDLASHYTIPAAKIEDLSGSSLFIGTSQPKDSLYTSTQSYWFDSQDQTSPPQETFPDVQFPWVLDPHATAQNTQLPGEIHYGNQTLDFLDYGYGIFKKTATTYHSPRFAGDPVTSLTKRVEKSENLDALADKIEAPEEYLHVPGSNYLLSERTLHSQSNDPQEQVDILNRYPRDPFGRQTAGYRLELDEDLNPIEETSTQTYLASEFDAATSLPTKVTYSDGEERTRTYNRIFREPQKTYYDRGITVFTRFDELGRKVSITNPSYEYAKTTNYYWTLETGENWSSQQTLTPPKKIDANVNQSVYVEIIRESNKPTLLTYFDRAGNSIRMIEIDENEQYTTTDTLFDDQGREAAVSNPYAPHEPITWTVNHHDVYGSVSKTSELIQKNNNPPTHLTY